MTFVIDLQLEPAKIEFTRDISKWNDENSTHYLQQFMKPHLESELKKVLRANNETITGAGMTRHFEQSSDIIQTVKQVCYDFMDQLGKAPKELNQVRVIRIIIIFDMLQATQTQSFQTKNKTKFKKSGARK